MEIFEKRGRWCFIGSDGLIKKFKTKDAALAAGGKLPEVSVSGVPYKVPAEDLGLLGDED